MPDLLDLFQRLVTTTRNYLYVADPQHGVPRSVTHETRKNLTALLDESDQALNGALFQTPKETDPT